MARSYGELLVWQKAKALAVQIYQATEQFPKNETYGLTSQVRRAAVSVASTSRRAKQINSRRIPALPRPSARLSTGTRHSTGHRARPYLKPDRFEILDREIYPVLGLLNRLIDSLA